MNYRVFVKKKEMFQVEAQSLHHELKQNLNLSSLTGLELYNVYDIFHGDEHDIALLKEKVLSEKVTDEVFDSVDLNGKHILRMSVYQGSMISELIVHSNV